MFLQQRLSRDTTETRLRRQQPAVKNQDDLVVPQQYKGTSKSEWMILMSDVVIDLFHAFKAAA